MWPDVQSFLPEGLLSGHFAGMAAVVFAAALTQGIGGIGFAMVSAPIALLFFPELAPGPLLVLGAGIALLGVYRDFVAINWRSVGILMAGRISGSVVAGATISLISTTLFSVVFALLILLGVGLSVTGWRVRATDPNMVIAGIVSGLMGTITSSGAPPYAIVMQHTPPEQLRATLGCVFFAGAALSVVILAAFGHFAMSEFWLGLLLFPAMMAGFAISTPLNRFVPRHATRYILLGLAGGGAIGILLRAWLVG